MYPDGTTSLSNFTTVSQNGGQLAGFRNQIINGDFRIWQRGSVFSDIAALSSTATYTADHVAVFLTGATTGEVLFDRGSVSNLEGFSGCLQNDTNGTAYVLFPVELDRSGGYAAPFIQGQTYTASWYQTDSIQPGNNLQFKANVPGSVTGDCPTVGSLKSEPTGVNDWIRYSQSFTIEDPTGNPNSLVLTVLVGAGQSITGAQLEPGPVATPFEYRPISVELSMAQRYFETGRSKTWVGGAAGGGIAMSTQYKVKKREIATLFYGTTTGFQFLPSQTESNYVEGFVAQNGGSGEIAFTWSADAEL